MSKLETMNFYIDAGRFLNDYDRNNNFDLAEILRFFKPNNRLFGDYEIRGKDGLENYLDRKTKEGKPCIIPKKDIDEKVPDGWLLLFVISGQDLFVNYGWIKINHDTYIDNGEDATEIEYDDLAEEALDVDPKEIHQIYVLDPIKLKQISNLDDGRNKSFKTTFLEYFFRSGFVNYSPIIKKILYNVVDEIVKEKKKRKTDSEIFKSLQNIFIDESILKEILKPNDLNDVKNNLTSPIEKVIKTEDLKKIIAAFNGTDERLRPLVKLKNFEKFDDVKIRLGKYEDGRYVIYLHPYKSESNCPGRIPAE